MPTTPGGAQATVPVCSFCGESPVAVWFEGPDYRTAVRSADTVRAAGAWLACSTCFSLVGADDREGLARRAAADPRKHDGGRTLQEVRVDFDQRFWTPRSSEP
ncbi:MAG: hypothetical protein ACM3OO_10335 [Planctomycetaceae bacterium]